MILDKEYYIAVKKNAYTYESKNNIEEIDKMLKTLYKDLLPRLSENNKNMPFKHNDHLFDIIAKSDLEEEEKEEMIIAINTILYPNDKLLCEDIKNIDLARIEAFCNKHSITQKALLYKIVEFESYDYLTLMNKFDQDLISQEPKLTKSFK